MTIASDAYKELIEKIDTIERYVVEKKQAEENLDDMWVDSYDVCKYLQISERTLQRLRVKKVITYSILQGKTYYTLKEIKRALSERVIRRGKEQMDELIAHYQKNVISAKCRNK